MILPITESNERLRSRVYNWKFRQAVKYLDGENQDVCHTVETLADLFEDAGWFDGQMSDLVDSVVGVLLRDRP